MRIGIRNGVVITSSITNEIVDQLGLKVTARDGYMVMLSTGEIAPDFGGKQALVFYRRDDEPAGNSGLRLVMPGDRRGGRNVRDVVTIDVE